MMTGSGAGVAAAAFGDPSFTASEAAHGVVKLVEAYLVEDPLAGAKQEVV